MSQEIEQSRYVPVQSGIKTTEKMCIDELQPYSLKMPDFPKIESSHVHASPQTSKKSANVLSKINKMEAFYVQRIRQLEFKCTKLQQTNLELTSLVQSLKQSLQNAQQQLKRQLAFNQQEVDKAVDVLGQNMLHKFKNEATMIYENAEKEKEELQGQLSKEKAHRINLQVELEQIKEEKATLQTFYCDLVESHRRLLKADIERNKATLYKSQADLSKSVHSSGKKEKLQMQIMKLKKANKTIEKDIEDSKTDNKKKKNNIFQLASDIKSLKQKL